MGPAADDCPGPAGPGGPGAGSGFSCQRARYLRGDAAESWRPAPGFHSAPASKERPYLDGSLFHDRPAGALSLQRPGQTPARNYLRLLSPGGLDVTGRTDQALWIALIVFRRFAPAAAAWRKDCQPVARGCLEMYLAGQE